jgi:HK97 gp10 family phage protein
MTVEIRVDAKEVTEALDKLDSRESASALKKAVTAVAKFLKPKVKAEAPKGKTGKLRKGVKYRVKKSRRNSGEYYAAIRSFAPHHHLVVAGTKDRYTASAAYRGRMPANPYVDRTVDRYEQQALDIAEAELSRQLGLE